MDGIRDFVSENKFSAGIFTLLTLIMIILAYALVTVQSNIGVAYWDIFLYLNNALKMAGMGVGDTLYLPPILPFITSLFFKAGWVSETTLFAVSGVFYIAGALGLYLLLKIRFNEWESMAGALSFATFTIVIAWAASGALDVPSISLSIWALYLTILSVKKDSRFFYLAFPVAMLAFLTRYTSGLIIIPMLLVIYLNHPKKDQVKKALQGIIAGIIIYLPFMWYFYRNTGKPFPFSDLFVGTAAGAAGTNNPGYNLDISYYLKYIANYISSPAPSTYFQTLWPSFSEATILAYAIMGVIIIGIVIYLIKILKNLFESESFKTSKKQVYLKIILTAALGIILITTYAHMSFLYSEIILLMLSLSIYYLLKDLNLKHLDMDLLFFTWFGAFLLMHSFHPVKVDRYFITMIPPLAYGVALGINQISSLIKYKFSRWNATSLALSLFLILALLSSTAFYVSEMPQKDDLQISEEAMAGWIKINVPDYLNQTMVSDRGPAFSWYLKKYVNTRIPGNVQPGTFEKTLNDLNADYYIYSAGKSPMELKGYTVIWKIDNVLLYKKNE
ncbi:glycosyltransferase family 39 protein [Methanobacterium alcaliphilum]|uniref:glycosyltransferase family 39 protein n=1 Tax=Methanobacterium alcaliphilum TaxID=392018 RepID=UPI00200A482B|nr:glycosyltransferase family 39 protein [Methanobacterium alcaliphilum]MCK9150751.1 glycosyltransferase family 39 protein [Methanobacterium alcaliphilum]